MIVSAPCRCAAFEALQRRVMELEGELEEWRAHDRGYRDEVALIERCERVRRRLGLPPTRAKLLLTLIDRAGQVQTKERLIHVYADEEETCLKTIDVHVMFIRRALIAAGFKGAIETVWGAGFRIAPGMAAHLKAWLDEPDLERRTA